MMEDELRGGKRIGRVDGGRFVDERREQQEEPGNDEGFVSSEAIREAYAKSSVADEQLEHLEHVHAAIDVDALTIDQLDKLGNVATALLESWAGAVKARARR